MHKGKCSQTTHSFLVPLPLPFPVLKMPSTSELPFPVEGQHMWAESAPGTSTSEHGCVLTHILSHLSLRALIGILLILGTGKQGCASQTSKAAKTFVDICTAIENLLKYVIYTNNFYFILCNFKYIFSKNLLLPSHQYLTPI